MKKKTIIIFLLAFILIVAAITNPKKESFVDWAKEQLKKDSNALVGWGINLLGTSLISSATTTQNYVFFTIYDAHISKSKQIKVIGIFNNFIPLSKTSFNSNSETNKPNKPNKKTPVKEVSNINNDNSNENKSNITMLNVNNHTIDNVKSYKNGEDNKEIPIHLNDGEASIYFGRDHPNGIEIQFIKVNKGVSIELENIQKDLLDNGELPNGYTMQVGTHDFNNDKNEELVIAIGDGFSNGQVWVYSYHKVDDILKINPFHMEMTEFYQSKIIIDNDKIILPYGSQGLAEEYVWYQDSFLHKEY